MDLIVTRHGQTNWNKEGKVQGHIDIELNEEGKNQALIVKDLLKDEPIDLILCSPLKRAKETAKIIKGDRDILVIYVNDLIERDFGEFEGLTAKDFDLEGFYKLHTNQQYEKAETSNEFIHRVFECLRKIKKDYKNYQNVLIVTHAGVTAAIDCYFYGTIYVDNMRDHVLKNCEVKKYEYR